MGTGIGKYCKRCGEQLNYDDGFEDGFCNRCYHIVKFEAEKAPQRVEYEKRIKILGELSESKPRETEHIKLHKEVFCGVKPKEEEEWERELRFTYGHLYYQNEEGEFCQIVNEIDDLIDFISQLLSERTFSKEELRLLNAYLSLALPEYNNFDKETKMHEDMDKLHKILEKISKLLKEKE